MGYIRVLDVEDLLFTFTRFILIVIDRGGWLDVIDPYNLLQTFFVALNSEGTINIEAKIWPIFDLDRGRLNVENQNAPNASDVEVAGVDVREECLYSLVDDGGVFDFINSAGVNLVDFFFADQELDLNFLGFMVIDHRNHQNILEADHLEKIETVILHFCVLKKYNLILETNFFLFEVPGVVLKSKWVTLFGICWINNSHFLSPNTVIIV